VFINLGRSTENASSSSNNKTPTVNTDIKPFNYFANEQHFNINPDLPPEVLSHLLEIVYKRIQAFERSVSDLEA